MGPTCVCMFLHSFVLAICFLVSSSNQMGNRGYLIAENIVCENCKCGTRDSKFVSHTDLLAQPSVHFIKLPPETWNLYPRSSRQNPTAPLGSPDSVYIASSGYFRYLNWRYLPQIQPILLVYVRECPHQMWPSVVAPAPQMARNLGRATRPSGKFWRSWTSFFRCCGIGVCQILATGMPASIMGTLAFIWPGVACSRCHGHAKTERY